MSESVPIHFRQNRYLLSIHKQQLYPNKPAPKKVVTTKTATVKPQPPKPQNLQFSIFDKIDDTEVKDTKTDTLTAETDTNDDETDMPSEEEMQEILAEVHEEEQREKGNPTYQKYTAYQAEHQTAIVAYRLGDFYEVLGNNAVLLGNELDLTITSRDVGLKERIPMVGFPYHAAENYFAKIVKYHDLYIVENDNEKQFIDRVETAVNRHIDLDTGEILTEEEMREFDGDIEEPADISSSTEVSEPTTDDFLLAEKSFAKAFDSEAVCELSELLGDCFILA